MQKKWQLRQQVNQEERDHLSEQLGISKMLSHLLLAKGLNNVADIKTYVNPAIHQLHDPFLFHHMRQAVELLHKAIVQQKKILLYGDYDVDGTTSVALMHSFLAPYVANLSYYIPDRFKEGYGLSAAGIAYAIQEKVDLLITLDCGIKSVELIEQAVTAGIKVIVCDHHEPGIVLPPAHALLDAKLSDNPYPYKELSGCGVAFKLCQAYLQYIGKEADELWNLLDLVAVSTACDIVEMKGENRVLVHFGLQRLMQKQRPGLDSLIESAIKIDRPYQVGDLLFYAGPRINAAGRLKDAKDAVKLLLTHDQEEIAQYTKMLNEYNQERKAYEQQMSEEAETQYRQINGYEQLSSLVVHDTQWHKGVVGIVASRMVEKFYKPSIVLTKTPAGTYVGSARSVEGFDLYQAIEACAEHIEQFGGHTHAAGLTLKEENLDPFIKSFESYCKQNISEDSKQPIIRYDLEMPLSRISKGLYESIQRLAPFGPGNLEPLFVSRGVKDSGYARLIKEHVMLNFFIPEKNYTIGATAFNMKSIYEAAISGKLLDICYHLELNNFNGTEKLQLRIVDIKLSEI